MHVTQGNLHYSKFQIICEGWEAGFIIFYNQVPSTKKNNGKNIKFEMCRQENRQLLSSVLETACSAAESQSRLSEKTVTLTLL